MNNQLIPQEEFQTYTSLDGTTGGSQIESPSDSGFLQQELHVEKDTFGSRNMTTKL